VQIVRRRFTLGKHNDWQWMLAASDIHLGSVGCSLKHLYRDLARARELNARILMPGDIFDLILPKDHKRYTPGTVIKALRDRDDQINAVVDYAFDLLAPSADLIDMIGLGNHEATTIRFHAVDPVALLVSRLNEHLRQQGSEHKIRHGGYTGYVQYVVQTSGKERGAVRTYSVLYHHGTGGESTVTRGMIDVARKRTHWNYDAFIFGHKHHSWATRDVTVQITGHGCLEVRQTRDIQTGTYMASYPVRPESEASSTDYSEAAGHSPKPLGGVFWRWRYTGTNTNELQQVVEV